MNILEKYDYYFCLNDFKSAIKAKKKLLPNHVSKWNWHWYILQRRERKNHEKHHFLSETIVQSSGRDLMNSYIKSFKPCFTTLMILILFGCTIYYIVLLILQSYLAQQRENKEVSDASPLYHHNAQAIHTNIYTSIHKGDLPKEK